MCVAIICLCTSVAYAQGFTGGNGLDLKADQGLWIMQGYMEGEYFLIIQFSGNGVANFGLCRKNPEDPDDFPTVAIYDGKYVLDGEVIDLTFLNRRNTPEFNFSAEVNTVLRATSDGNTLTLAWLSGDPLFAGLWDGKELTLKYSKY